MSAQRTKKRFGSHRRVANQNEMPKTDKILATDNSNAAQHHIPEENIESSCVLSNHDNMPSPELKANRRKLGSRRKNKGHEKDLATELSEKPEEEASKNSQVNEALETQLAIQSERQEESGESYEHEMSVTSDNSSYSTITSAYCGIQNYIINVPEDIPQILHPKSENLQVEQDEDESDFKVMSSGNFVEPMLEQGNKSDSIQRELVKDNALLIDTSERVLSSQLGVSCVTEIEKKKWNKDADLLQQEGNISTIAETTTDKSNTTQNSTLECSTDTAMASPKYELSADEKQNEQFSLSLGSQPQDHSCSAEEHNDANVNTTVNRRKLGSSRKNKREKYIEDSVADPYHETKEEVVTNVSGYGDLETKMSSLETAVLVQPVEMTEGMDKPDTQTEILIGEVKEITHTPTINQQLTNQPIVSGMPHEIYSSVTDAGSEESELFRHWGVLQADNLVESTMTLAISTEKSNPRQDTEYEHSVEQASSKHEMSTNKEDAWFSVSEVRRAQDIDNAVKKVHEEDFKPTATQEISDSYQSELKSHGDYATKQGLSNLDERQDEYITQGNNVEALDQIHGDSHVYDRKKTQTSDIERVDNAVGQVHENEGWLENEIKAIVEQSSEHQEEGFPSEPIKSKTLQTLQSETRSPSESESEQNVNSTGAESKINDSLMMETVVQEMSVEVLLKGNERFDPVYTDGFSDQAKENTQVSTSELNSTSVDSSPPVDQQAIEQSKEEEGPQDVSSMYSVTDTETEERDEENDLLRQWGILQPSNLVNETHFKSENVESSIIPEITTEESNHEEHTEPETRVEQATASSLKGDKFTKDEQNKQYNISNVREALCPENASKKVYNQECQPTEIQENHTTDYSAETGTENYEICFANLTNQTEVSDSYQSESSVKSNATCDSKQEVSNPDENQDMFLNMEALDQIHGDSHVYDPKKTQTSDIERVDNAVGQVHENEGWLENEIKSIVEPSSEHQEEGLPSEPIKSKTLQTLHSETRSPSESQPRDNSVITDKQDSTDFNLIVNSGELESIHVNEGEQNVNSSGAESKMSLMMETVVQEMSVEVLLKGNERFDPVYTDGFSDQAKENTQVSTSELNSTSVDSSPPVDQQAIEQSKEKERPQDVSSMYSVTDTETEERDEENDLLRQWGILQPSNLVNKTHFKSENVESSIIPEITTEESNHEEHTEPETRVEQATASSPKDGMSAKDEQNVSDVRGALDSKDAVTKVHNEEVKPTEMHLVDYSTDKASISLQSEIEPSFDFQPNDSSLNIKEKIHTGFKRAGNKRKLGSSRRHKERQHVPDSVTEPYSNFNEEIVETIQSDCISEKEKMPSATETIRQDILNEQTGPDLNPTEKMRKNRSSKRDKENAGQMPKEDTTLHLHNSMDSSITVSTESDYLKSTEQINEVEKKFITEPNDLSPPTGHDTIKTDLIESAEVPDLKHCDDDDSNKPVTSDVLDQKEAIQEEEEKMNIKLTECTKETVGATTIQVDLNGECKDNTSNKVTHGESFSAAQNENVTCALVDTDREENSRPKPAVNMSEESDIPGTPSASNNQQGILTKPPVHGNVQETRRKMGSTRRAQLNRKQMYNKDDTKVNNLDVESDVRNSERVEVVEELSLILKTDVSQKGNTHPSLSIVSEEQQEIYENNSVYDERQKPESCTAHPQARECNMIPGVDDSTALTPEQSTFLSEEVVHPVRFVQGADEKDSEEKEEECINVTQGSGSKVKEAPAVGLADMETVKCVVRRGAGEQLQNAHVSVKGSNSVTEGGQHTNFETMNANFSPANRRRKMGSTRRNLRSRSKEKDLHQSQEVDKDVTATTSVGDASSESVSEVTEKELQIHDEKTHSDIEQKKEKVFETVECSHTGESHMKPPALQMVEENPGSPSRPAETEHHLTPDHLPAKPCTSPKHDVMSESATGGRRRKMGSHRKSHRHQNAKDQTIGEDETIDAQQGGDIRDLPDKSEEHREESLGLDRSSEVDKSDKKLPSNISGTAEHSQILSEKAPKRVTPVHQPNAGTHLDQEIQSKFSLGVSSEANVTSKVYHVLLVGDSSVGKTSFMKRAQSGKFSLDLPASIGLDSCRWTVVVDGKPVVLQLWDTAGQERFRSITRQIFHKAQAFLLMYDITSSQSFSAVSYWANSIQEGAAENATILLVGNKSDCAERRIKTEEGETLSKEYNFEFMECSAATGENVIQTLETVARMVKQKVDTREEAMALHKEPPLKKRSGCC